MGGSVKRRGGFKREKLSADTYSKRAARVDVIRRMLAESPIATPKVDGAYVVIRCGSTEEAHKMRRWIEGVDTYIAELLLCVYRGVKPARNAYDESEQSKDEKYEAKRRKAKVRELDEIAGSEDGMSLDMFAELEEEAA